MGKKIDIYKETKINPKIGDTLVGRFHELEYTHNEPENETIIINRNENWTKKILRRNPHFKLVKPEYNANIFIIGKNNAINYIRNNDLKKYIENDK